MPDQNQSNCQQISEMLSAFRDMELTLEEVDLVEAHLEGCPSCQRELDEIEMVVSHLKALPAPPVIDFADAIESRIAAASSAAAAAAADRQAPVLAAAGDNVMPFARPAVTTGAKRFPALAFAAVAAALFLGFAAATTMVPRQPAELAQSPRTVAWSASPQAKKVESEKTTAPLSEDVVALYDEEGATSSSDAGISTNEDGLYAIKM